MTGLVVALLGAVVLVALLILAARDAFRQASGQGWTEEDDSAVMRLLQGSRH